MSVDDDDVNGERVNYKNYSIWRFHQTQNEAEAEENDNFVLVLMWNIVWKIFYSILKEKGQIGSIEEGN